MLGIQPSVRKNVKSSTRGLFLGTPELVILLVIVILLFGVGRIGKIAGEIGSGLKAFREGLGETAQGGDGENDSPAEKP